MAHISNGIKAFYGRKTQIASRKTMCDGAWKSISHQKVTMLQKSACFSFDKKMLNYK
jgi:hypothetical protein